MTTVKIDCFDGNSVTSRTSARCYKRLATELTVSAQHDVVSEGRVSRLHLCAVEMEGAPEAEAGQEHEGETHETRGPACSNAVSIACSASREI